ncbi:MFS transporter [Streptomyces sp. NBC_01525]|uniref:MFS transporter n=1 Tax=Streptomyces sp. NBC_01525 TaxID=2903893 RepID=UPI003869323E
MSHSLPSAQVSDGVPGGRTVRGGRSPVPLLAVAAAVTAANVYLNQPLLDAIARSLGADAGTLGALPTVTQAGYAAGILLLVPAGDSHDRRRLILTLGWGSAAALAVCAVAPSVWCLLVAGFALGVLSPVPQLLTPLAVALADASGGPAAGRGRIVGTVQGGLLVGVLASRAYAGALAELAGWRTVYGVSCLATLGLMAVLRRALPPLPAAGGPGYRATLASLPRLWWRPVVRVVTVSGALVGVAFGAFWTTLTFLLAHEHRLDPARIGLFGLVAAASAAASPYAGRLAERWGRRGAMAALTGLVVAGWLVLLPGTGSLWWVIAGVIVLDVGVWGGQATTQTVLFRLDAAQHNRLNTLYFTLRFLGIAAGSLCGALAWTAGGWPAVVATGCAAALAGLLVGLLPVGDAGR